MTEESKASIDGVSTSPSGELPFDNTQGPNKSPQDIVNDAAHEEELANTPRYETQMSKDDAPKNLEVEGDIGSVMDNDCLLYTSPSPRDGLLSRMPSSA